MRGVLMLVAAAAGLTEGQLTVHLSERTDQAFDAYVGTAEAGMKWQPNPMPIGPWAGKSPVQVEDGLIHDWVSSVSVPGATPGKALAIFRDYDNYKKIFAPDVIDSKLLSHDRSHWRARLRIRRKGVITVVLDGDYEIEYRPLEQGRWAIISRSARITEMDGDRELPAGSGHGFLWRLNVYWLLTPRNDGLELDCRSISLSRDIPAGLGWVVGPVVSNVPRDSLRDTLEAVARALR